MLALRNAIIGIKTPPKGLNCMNMILIGGSNETIVGD
jgi:hypothetical protein